MPIIRRWFTVGPATLKIRKEDNKKICLEMVGILQLTPDQVVQLAYELLDLTDNLNQAGDEKPAGPES